MQTFLAALCTACNTSGTMAEAPKYNGSWRQSLQRFPTRSNLAYPAVCAAGPAPQEAQASAGSMAPLTRAFLCSSCAATTPLSMGSSAEQAGGAVVHTLHL